MSGVYTLALAPLLGSGAAIPSATGNRIVLDSQYARSRTRAGIISTIWVIM